MVRDRILSRTLGSTWFRLIVLGVIAALMLAASMVWLGARSRSAHRQAFVVIGNPMVVVSWDRTNDTFLLIHIPPEAHVDAIHGYGTYALSALWKLDSIDKRRGSLIAGSLEEALATPIRWYIDAGYAHPIFTNDPLADLQDIFSPLRLINYAFARTTNIPLPDIVALARLVPTLRGDAVTVFDLSRRGVLYEETLADGTRIRKVDTQRFDALIGDALEDEAVRKESVRIAVLNTTDMPGLGQRVARLLGTSGVFVTSVGNEDVSGTACELSGTAEYLGTRTADLIVSLYGCKMTKTESAGRSDLILKLGKEYARRFLPL